MIAAFETQESDTEAEAKDGRETSIVNAFISLFAPVELDMAADEEISAERISKGVIPETMFNALLAEPPVPEEIFLFAEKFYRNWGFKVEREVVASGHSFTRVHMLVEHKKMRKLAVVLVEGAFVSIFNAPLSLR